jgi:outer membrane protein, multidrug efflux system
MYALKIRYLFGLVVASLFSACSSMAPKYEAPPLPVLANYAEHGNNSGLNASTTYWQDYFTDPRLQALITLALRNNQDLKVAAMRVEEARASYGIQRADQYPTLGLQAGLDRSRTPADLSFTGRPLLASQYQVALGVANWEADFWGRVRSLKDAALESYLATDQSRRTVIIGLITQVAILDINLREIDERIVLAQKTIASRKESLRIFTRRVEVGATSKLNLTQVQTLLSQAQALGAQLEQTRELQLNALTLLIGTSLVLKTQQGNLGRNYSMPELQAGLPSELLISRPDIIAAEHLLKASNANIGAARAAFFPRVALTATLGTASAELNGLFANGSSAWIFSPTISLPIFDGGRRENNLKLTQARHSLAVINYEKTIQNAFREVSDALVARRWLDQQVDIAKVTLKTQTKRTRLTHLRYDNGASSFLEVLDAERDLLSAEQQSVQTYSALIKSRISLYAALGGGSQLLKQKSIEQLSNKGKSTP